MPAIAVLSLADPLLTICCAIGARVVKVGIQPNSQLMLRDLMNA